MKLYELSPAAGSVKSSFRKGRGAGSGNGKTAVRDTRVRMLAPAVAFVPDLREVSFLFTESFPREALRTDLRLITQS